jgi:hypothetical protein
MRKEIATMVQVITRTPAYIIQAICYFLIVAILVSWPISVLAQGSSQWDKSEHQRILDGQASLDKEIAVLQASVNQHHSEQDSQHFPERVAILETKMANVDSKLNMVLGVLVTLCIAFISDFIRRIRLDRRPI